MSVAVVLGTYNRRPLLERSIESIVRSLGADAEPLGARIVVIDGGSTDGSREWLRAHPLVHLICQEGPLTGAVGAFNLGFGYCVDEGFDFVVHLNDDAEFVTAGAIQRAIEIMHTNGHIGEVAFEHDLRGDWRFEYINGRPYANFGLIRTNAGVEVAKAQGDPTGRAWWNPIYRTYGADTEFGVWLWKLGWKVIEGVGLRVHDMQAQDELRVANTSNNKNGDSDLFWSRWRNEQLVKNHPTVRRRRPPPGPVPQRVPPTAMVVPQPPKKKPVLITTSMRGRPGNTK